MRCVDDKTMYEIIDGALGGEGRRAAMEHIRGCEKCANRLRVLEGLERTSSEAWGLFRAEECPAPEVLHGYSERTLPAEEHANVQKHLDQCEVCSLILDRAAWAAEEYARQEQEWLKSNEERVGRRRYSKVKQFVEERYERAQEMLAMVDVYLLQLKPVPVFRGKKPAKEAGPRVAIFCKGGTVLVMVDPVDSEGVRVQLVDKGGKVVAEGECSTEGIATFEDMPEGYYFGQVAEA
jgi:hypothetical protein